MRANSPGAFLFSTTLHGGVVALIVVLSLWVHRATEIRPLDFDLVDLDQLEIGEKTELIGPADGPPKIGFTKPNVKRVKIPAPAKVVPAPASKLEKASKAPVKEAKPSKVKTTSYADFKKTNQKQIDANQKVRTNSRNTPAPGIDAKGIVNDLMRTASGTGASRNTVAALDAYFARLISALRAAHEMPDSVSDLLVAKVSFFLASDGSISRVRVVRSSGSADYDESVVDAFNRVRSIGAVPGGKSGTYEINFKMTE